MTGSSVGGTIEERLAEELARKEFLENEAVTIASPEALGGTIMNVVWEQFMNQLASATGMEYKNANGDLLYNISKEDLYLTPKDFEQGILPSRNPKLKDIEKRYKNYVESFKTDDNGHVLYNKDKKVIKEEARAFFDAGRPMGSKTVNNDHTIPLAEIIRDPEINAYIDKEVQKQFANGKDNLKPMDSAANQSKGDLAMTDWLEKERKVPGYDEPLKPDERYNIDKEECLENDRVARDAREKLVKEGKEELDREADRVRRTEIKKAAGMALKAAFIRLLAELVKEIVKGFIAWLSVVNRTIDILIEYIKQSIISFLKKLRNQLMNVTQSVISAIATAIIGPIVGMIMKVWVMIKTGWNSIREAIHYVKTARERNIPYIEMVTHTSEIIVSGLCGIGAIVLGETITSALSAIPGFSFEIPSIGSFASIMGIFAGATISGIVGAVAINRIELLFEEYQRAAIREKKIDNNSRIMSLQGEILGNQMIWAEENDEKRSVKMAQNEEDSARIIQKLQALMSETTVLE